MKPPQVPAERTFAIVVGIEKYEAGPAWDVDGPASDACRFVDWLRKAEIPDTHISLFLSPLESNRNLLERSGPAARPAIRENITRSITGPLRQQQGDLLFIYWAGHGIVSLEGSRRLFYADATDGALLNLDLGSLLHSLLTDYWPGFARQVCLVDACANYLGKNDLSASLPEETFAASQLVKGRQQFVVLGARAGDIAEVDTRAKTGLFSRELLAVLAEDADSRPPDMDRLKDNVRKRLLDLRSSDQTSDQAPTFYWYEDWEGSKGTYSDGSPAVARSPSPRATSRRTRLDFAVKSELIDHLLSCWTISDPARRSQLISQMRPEIFWSTKQTGDPQFDVLGLLDNCLRFRGGLDDLFNLVRFGERGSDAWQDLDSFRKTLPPGL